MPTRILLRPIFKFSRCIQFRALTPRSSWAINAIPTRLSWSISGYGHGRQICPGDEHTGNRQPPAPLSNFQGDRRRYRPSIGKIVSACPLSIWTVRAYCEQLYILPWANSRPCWAYGWRTNPVLCGCLLRPHSPLHISHGTQLIVPWKVP